MNNNNDNSITVSARSFRCSSCGSPLKIPKNSKGHVQCPSCRNDCVIEGLVKNAEVAAKADINSGISLDATPSILHSQIVSLLSGTPNIPLDVFEKVEIVREERYCVPCFYFEYDAMAPFRYQQGRRETRQERGFKSDGRETITTITETKWYPQTGNASVNGSLFLSGNKELANYVNKLYAHLDPSDLVDFEYLEYPHDVKTFDSNLPEGAVFNEHVKPVADSEIKKDVQAQLQNEAYVDDVNISGSKITKTVKRVFLGLYRVVYTYNGNEYSLWTTGNGKKTCHEGMPEDQSRKTAINEKTQAKAAVTLKTGLLTFGLWIGIITMIMGLLAAFGHAGAASLILLLPGLALAILCGIKRSKKKEAHTAQCGKIQKEIDEIVAQATNEAQKFKSQKKALRGIYEGVSGDAEAF